VAQVDLVFPQDQIDELKKMYPVLSTAEEGDFRFILIENLKLPEGCEPKIVKGLLCPMTRDGYPSRLFLSAKVTHKGKGQNWNPQNGTVILGEHWWAVSWKTTRSGQTIREMLLDHLEAFRI
jgi:hypothetical protein